jgi:hypothetical protein
MRLLPGGSSLTLVLVIVAFAFQLRLDVRNVGDAVWKARSKDVTFGSKDDAPSTHGNAPRGGMPRLAVAE